MMRYLPAHVPRVTQTFKITTGCNCYESARLRSPSSSLGMLDGVQQSTLYSVQHLQLMRNSLRQTCFMVEQCGPANGASDFHL